MARKKNTRSNTTEEEKRKRRLKKRRERERERYHYLLSQGVPPKKARSMRGWGKKKIADYLAEQERKKHPPRKLMIFWTDVTEMAPDDAVQTYKREARHMGIPEMILNIRGLLTMRFGEIGKGVPVVTDDPKGMAFMFDDHHTVYEGKAIRYDHILRAVYTMMNLLYDPFDKYAFMMELVQNIRELNEKIARRLVSDFDL